MDNKHLNRELLVALKNVDKKRIALLVNAQDNDGYTALHWAVKHRDKDTAQLLTDNGASVNAQDKRGNTPLHWAIQLGYKDIADLLINKNANVNAQNDNGSTPLHWAARQGRMNIAQSLIANKANVNAKNNKGNTALYWAARAKSTDMCMLLLDYGTPTIRDLERCAKSAKTGYVKKIFTKAIEVPAQMQEILADPQFPTAFRETLARLIDEARQDAGEATAMRSFMLRVNAMTQTLNINHTNLIANAITYASAHAKKELSWKMLATPLLGDTLSDCDNIHDMTQQFADTVLLPALIMPLLSNDTEKNTALLASLNLDVEKLRSRLHSVADDALLSHLPPHQILGLSRAWHAPRSNFPQNLRPLTGGRWHPLTENLTIPQGHKAAGWQLLCLASSDDLKKEDDIRGNYCVASYTESCKSGTYHIYSLRDHEGNYVSTIGVYEDGATFRMGQNLDSHNKTPSATALAAGEWLLHRLHKGPNNIERGETEESKRAIVAPAVIRAIGYWPTPQHIGQCFQHYTQPCMNAFVWDPKRHAHFSNTNGPALVHKYADSLITHAQRLRFREAGALPYDKGFALWLRASGAEEELNIIRREIVPNLKETNATVRC